MRKYIHFLLIILFCLTIDPAYSCVVPTSPKKEFEKSDLIFAGTLQKLQCKLIEKPNTLKITRTYVPKALWKGTINQYVKTQKTSRMSTCDDKQCKKIRPKSYEDINSEEPIGSRYIIYGRYVDGSGFLTVDSSAACGHSRRLPSYEDIVKSRMRYKLSVGKDIGIWEYTLPELAPPLKIF